MISILESRGTGREGERIPDDAKNISLLIIINYIVRFGQNSHLEHTLITN